MFSVCKKIILLLFLAANVYAAEITLIAGADKGKVALNDYLVYSVAISGDSADFPEPKIGELEDFVILGSGKTQNISFANGKRKGNVTYKYTLLPKKMGKFTIPVIEVVYKKESYFTKPVDIEVTAAEKIQQVKVQHQGASSSGRRTEEVMKGNVFVKASVDKKNVYVNEKLTYRFKFYTNVDLVSQPTYYAPDFRGFWNDFSKPLSSHETVDGANYLVNEIETVLYPVESGKIIINPAKLRITVMDFSSGGNVDDIFSLFASMGQRREKLLETDSVNVNVLALPKENVPEGFKGAVGSFEILASLDKTEIQTNEPVTLTIKVTGKGNMKSVSDIEFVASKDFKIYDTISSDVSEDIKEFKILMVPLTAGEKTIPPVKLYFFDPAKKTYSHAATSSLKIKVEGTSIINSGNNYENNITDIVKTNNDINYIKQIKKINTYYKGYFIENKVLKIVFAPLAVFFILALYFSFYLKKKNRDPVSQLKADADELSRKCIVNAAEKINSEKCHDFYEAAYEALIAAVTAKTGIKADNLSVAEISKNLENSGFDKNKLKEAEEILNRINFYRFASVKSDERIMRELLGKIQEILNILRKP